MSKTPIAVAYGDGVGPELMKACLRILEAAGAQLAYESVDLGEKVYAEGITSGIGPKAWESIRGTRVLYKAPVNAPSHAPMKSVTMTLRKTLGLYANIRPCVAYHPFVSTRFPGMNVVVIRENEEGLYAGIEHRQTPNVYQTLKIVSTRGTERIIRYAFEYAVKHGRKKVSCFTKDSILKLTDGLFHSTFERVAREYPGIQSEHAQVDIGAARFVDVPEEFDVLVLPNLYGDILSAMAAEMAGSVQVAASANVGDRCAMFEAIHGAEPYQVDKDIANPSGLLLSGVMMLEYLGQTEVAHRVKAAWLKTLEEHIHTPDVFDQTVTQQVVGTQAFADAVIQRLGVEPEFLQSEGRLPVSLSLKFECTPYAKVERVFVGVDVFSQSFEGLSVVSKHMQQAALGLPFELTLITSRGVKVWPEGSPETSMSEHWRCRFKLLASEEVVRRSSTHWVSQLLQHCADLGIDVIKTENLYEFDGEPGFSAGQGE